MQLKIEDLDYSDGLESLFRDTLLIIAHSGLSPHQKPKYNLPLHTVLQGFCKKKKTHNPPHFIITRVLMGRGQKEIPGGSLTVQDIKRE